MFGVFYCEFKEISSYDHKFSMTVAFIQPTKSDVLVKSEYLSTSQLPSAVIAVADIRPLRVHRFLKNENIPPPKTTFNNT